MAVTRLNPPYTPPLPSVNGWYFGHMVSGWGFIVPLPSLRAPASVSVTSAQVWTPSSGWQTLTYSSQGFNGGNVMLNFDASGTSAEGGKTYLVNIVATLS